MHPTERSPADHSPRVLVARQQFGNGFTAAMNTDLLWRWKLSLPSTNRSVEIFWQQFFLALAQPAQGQSVELMSRTEAPQLNRAVVLRVSGAGEAAPTLTVRSPQGKERRLTLAAVESAGAGNWETSFIPDAEGCWFASASTAEGDAARISIPVSAQIRTAEQMNLPPDVDGLRQLADSTGGAIIDSASPVFRQHAVQRPAETLRAQPLWNRGWFAFLLLGLYAVELVTRRVFKLL